MTDQAPPPSEKRDPIARYLDLATLTLLVLGLGSWVLSIEPPLLITLWSLAIFTFVLARVRAFYMHYRYTRLLYWLPLLAGNVKRRVYVRSRLGRLGSMQHDHQVAAGAVDEAEQVDVASVVDLEDSIFPSDLPEATEVEDDQEAADLPWNEETQVIHAETTLNDEDDFSPVAADEEEPPAGLPLNPAPSVDPARLARLRSRLAGGAQNLSHLAPPVRVPSEEAVPATEIMPHQDVAATKDEINNGESDLAVDQDDEELDLTDLDFGDEDELGEDELEQGELEREDLAEEELEDKGAPALEESSAEVPSVAPMAMNDSPASNASNALRDRLRQRQESATVVTPAPEVDSSVLRDRLRQRVSGGNEAAQAAVTPATEVASEEVAPAPANDAAARLRERLSQRQGGESN